jgi:D-inositol-3-phosphate glycosyltransferase
MRLAVISAHTCPLATLGGKETGGMNVYTRETCRALGRQGVEVDIFTRSQDHKIPPETEMDVGVRVLHIPAGPHEPYDKYLMMNHISEFVQGILSYGRGDYDLIQSHYWISGVIALELRRRLRTPVIHMFHTLGYLKNRVARSSEELEPGLRLQMEREIARQADHLIAAQPLERAQLIWHYDADPSRVRVIPCGVDISLFCPKDKEESRRTLNLANRPWLLFVGRLEPIKGLDTLLKALLLVRKKCTDAALLIVGGDRHGGKTSPDRSAAIQAQVESFGLEDHVFFGGAQDQRNLPLFYNAAEICILPSRYESFGMVALEAMACGVPVIASNVGGLSFTVQNGQTGFLVPEGDSQALADCIAKTLNDRILRGRLSRKAAERARSFTWDKIVSSIMDLYHHISSSRWCDHCREEDLEPELMEKIRT